MADVISIDEYATWVETQKDARYNNEAYTTTNYEKRQHWISKLRIMASTWAEEISRKEDHMELEFGIFDTCSRS